jgi:hypothetical protein
VVLSIEERVLYVHSDFPKALYINILRRLRDAVRRKNPEKWRNNSWFLFYYSTPAHRSVFVKNFLSKNNVTTPENPQDSPGLAATDFLCVTLNEIGKKGTALMWCY